MHDIQPPQGIYNSVKDWVEANVESVSQGAVFKEIYPGTTFSRRLKRPPTRYPTILEGGSVGVIPNGRVWGLNGAIVTPDNHLIWDASLEFVHPRSNHSIFKEEILFPISQHCELAADLTHVVGRNYYHWMYEVIPRIHLLRESGVPVERFIVKQEPDHLPFQSETLHHLGIMDDQLIKTYEGFHLQADRLVVPSQPAFATKWGFDFLRRTFLIEDNQLTTENKRIYISRKWSRIITNESDLWDLLKPYGFIKVELETLSVAEQARLFSTAEVIVGAHGAGLANLTFCRPDTKVIEIFTPTFITPLYWVISSFGKLDHHYFIGHYGGPGPTQENRGWAGLDNITVNLRRFAAFMRNMKL
ncbi:glycosyltransferase family 61 protein [Neobacillus drentensis]|uniref:glycosyltransferase family 61 protein n=1 Tax=Neobacillus drentensis TaxID=220684 RepID=UPI00082637CE|nr:glycosyltransferase family 61 protein [Neobacillus drentensis]